MTDDPTERPRAPLEPRHGAELAARAAQARQWAYAPYSHYPVGAALLTASGKIYDGVNVENAAYGDTICAERTAAVKAVSEGEREFVAIAVASEQRRHALRLVPPGAVRVRPGCAPGADCGRRRPRSLSRTTVRDAVAHVVRTRHARR